MGRKPREISSTGIYHVCIRGVNKQRIFEYVEDYDGFFRILRQSRNTDTEGKKVESPNFELFAYCLMDNHVHLLIAPNGLTISEVVKRISSSYARFFNYRYHRVGHLFQDRFRSEACLDRDYLYTLLRYIHCNPVKAGICIRPDEYPYSSYCEIISEEVADALCSYDTLEMRIGVTEKELREFVREMVIDDRMDDGDVYASVRQFISEQYYNLKVLTDEEGLVPKETQCLTDEDRSLVQKFTQWCQTLLCNISQAKQDKADADTLDKLITEALLGLSGTSSISDFQRLDKKTMRNVLAQIRDAGISIRRLSRISGISEGIIRGSKNPRKMKKQ